MARQEDERKLTPEITGPAKEALDLLLTKPTGSLDECEINPEKYPHYLKIIGDQCIVMVRNTFYYHDIWEYPPLYDEDTQVYCQFPVAELLEALGQLQVVPNQTKEPNVGCIWSDAGQTMKTIPSTFVYRRAYTGGQNYIEGDPDNLKILEEIDDANLVIIFEHQTYSNLGYGSQPDKTYTTAKMVIIREHAKEPYATIEGQSIHQDPTDWPEETTLGNF